MAEDPPEVTILLIGDAACGKSTFLSFASPSHALLHYPFPVLYSNGKLILNFRRISQGSDSHDTKGAIKPLKDGDQPFIFDIRFFNHPYRFQFYDTASPEHWTLLKPDVIVICYDVSSRLSLINIKRVWVPETKRIFTMDKELPILLLGLKRDLRREDDPNGIIYPQEGHKIAQESRCDRYMECSARTGELVHEVFEDICRTAAMSTKGEGEGFGLSKGGCLVM